MGRKRKGRDLSGWLVIDKPAGITSTAVVNKVKWALDAKKAGHAGTLDPEATGVLAIALGEAEGFVKTVFDAKTGELLGAHMIGAEVTEMIQGFVVGKTLETTEAELMQTVFPHPTISESMHESVLASYGRALHI